MDLKQRAAIGGTAILPMLKGLKEQLPAPLEMSDDDVIFAAMWAVVHYSVQTTGGTAAIEKLRDVLDEIEKSGPFGIR